MRFVLLIFLSISALAQEGGIALGKTADTPKLQIADAIAVPELKSRRSEGIQRVSYVPVRNTVMSGPTTNGYASFISSGTGLTAIVDGSVNKIIITAAEGFDERGPVDFVYTIDSRQTITLQDNTINYIFAEYNRFRGSVELFTSTQGVNIGYTLPSASANKYAFNISEYRSYFYTDKWERRLIVPLGECTTVGGAITEASTYALNGVYDSGLIDWSGAANLSKNHFLGIQPPFYNSQVQFYITSNANGFSIGEYINGNALSYGDAAGVRGYEISNLNRNTFVFTAAGTVAFISRATFGGVNLNATKLNLIAKRGF